jgi:hypothetical protein
MKTYAACAILALLALLALPAFADKVTLKDGRAFEGKLVRESATEITLAVVVMGKTVEMTVPLDQVEKFERTSSVLDQYEAKASRADRKDPDALADLSAWCRGQKLPEQAARHALEALALKPDHAASVKMLQELGYVREGKTWVPKPAPKKTPEPATARTAGPAQAELDEARRGLEASEAGLKKIEADLTAAEKKLAAAARPEDVLAAQKEMDRLITALDQALKDCESHLQVLEKLYRSQAAGAASTSKPEPAPASQPHP